MALQGSKQHTVGNTTRWTLKYGGWLDNTATVEQIAIESDSPTCTVGDITILGQDVVFFLIGGTLSERLTLSLTMADNLGNIKHDTIAFTVVAP